jgi:hypothetical protein
VPWCLLVRIYLGPNDWLLVICGILGFSAVRQQWFQSKKIGVLDWIKLTYLGTRQIFKIDNLQTHKQLNTLLVSYLFVDL